MRPGLRHFLHTADWFTGAERDFTITAVDRAGELPLPDEGPAVAIDLVTVEFAEGETCRYQVPVSLRPEEDERLSAALIGVWDDPDHGRSHAYDAMADPEAMAQVLAAFAQASADTDPTPGLTFHRVVDSGVGSAARPTPFKGRQSNSLVTFGDKALLKVFRRAESGRNPDVELRRALAAAGSEDVACLLGWLDMVDPNSGSVVQLGVLQEFVRADADGWELATASVRGLLSDAGGDSDFTDEATELGSALARVHSVLAEAFGTDVLTGTEATNLAARMEQRLLAALEAVPDLVAHRDGLSALFDRVAALDGVPVQRIHGDLHLGQTLHSEAGWRFIDFEGEPERPLAERALPAPAWTDVASMLRSFDYAAQVVARVFDGADERTDAWAQGSGDAFLAAYAPDGLARDQRLLLDACQAERAVVECLHEAVHRPTWLPIPLRGIQRLVAAYA